MKKTLLALSLGCLLVGPVCASGNQDPFTSDTPPHSSLNSHQKRRLLAYRISNAPIKEVFECSVLTVAAIYTGKYIGCFRKTGTRPSPIEVGFITSVVLSVSFGLGKQVYNLYSFLSGR